MKAAKAGLSEIAVGGIVTAAMNPSASGSVVIDEKYLELAVRVLHKVFGLDKE